MKLNKLIFAAAALLVLGCGKKGTEDVLVPEKGSYTGTVTVDPFCAEYARSD